MISNWKNLARLSGGATRQELIAVLNWRLKPSGFVKKTYMQFWQVNKYNIEVQR